MRLSSYLMVMVAGMHYVNLYTMYKKLPREGNKKGFSEIVRPESGFVP